MIEVRIEDLGEPLAELSSVSGSSYNSAPSSGEIRDVEATFRLTKLQQSLAFARKKGQFANKSPDSIKVRARVPVVETCDLAPDVEHGAAHERN
jgi:hypothetical protein